MRIDSLEIARLVVVLTMILTPFAPRVSAAPSTVDAGSHAHPGSADMFAMQPRGDEAATPAPAMPLHLSVTRSEAEQSMGIEASSGSPGQKDAAQQAAGLALHLQRATFDPLTEAADLPPELVLDAYSGQDPGYYFVQFHGPILPAWREELERIGVTIHDYVPQYAYVVRMDQAMAVEVRNLEEVRWVGLYQPAFRVSTALDESVTEGESGRRIRVVVRSFTGAPSDRLGRQIESLGGQLLTRGGDSGGGTLFRVELPADAVASVAGLDGVAWVEPWAETRLTNEITRSPLVFDKDGVEDRLGLYGAGQIVVVADTGVSTGDEATMHQDLRGRVYTGTWGSGTCGTWRDDNSHGTHVAGSVLGSGVMDGAVTSTHSYAGSNAGIAPEALLWAWSFCTDWSGLPQSDPYNAYYGVMYHDDARVRVNTNSWSYNAPAGSYNAFSRETDRFIWDHPDMVVLFSAGNDGTDADVDGVVDQDSMGVPSGSKNIITIGASENYRMSGGYNPGSGCPTWGGCWPADFPAAPVSDDRLSDDASGMAAFSSRGPTDDGRLKPDLVAPGSNIVSTRYEGSSTGWGAYDASYIYMGGTSMSTPLVAGASAIVREFYSVTYGITPTAALVKGTLINGAYDMTPGQYRDEVPAGSKDDVVRRPDTQQGWGRVDLLNSLVYDAPRSLWFHEDRSGLSTEGEYSVTLSVQQDTNPFRVTLVWADYPGLEAANGALINDLDLEVVAPSGMTYQGNDMVGDGALDGDVDHTNNVEGVDLDPLIGQYVIKVTGCNIPQGPQPFALVVSGDMEEAEDIVFDASTLRGVEAARIETTLQPTGTTSLHTSGFAGHFSMPDVSGSYSVTAEAYGYQPGDITATIPSSNHVQIPLAPAPLYTLQGTITDMSTGYPVHASVTITGDPFDPPAPNDEAWTDSLSGHYSLTLSSQVAYTLRVEAIGYLSRTSTIGQLLGDGVYNAALEPDLTACTAPGYGMTDVLFRDGFESGSLGSDWSTYTMAQGRVRVSDAYPHIGGYSAVLDDTTADTTYSTAALDLTQDLTGRSSVFLRFWWREFDDEDHPQDGVFITDNGGIWAQVLSFNTGPSSFRQEVIDIASEAAANGLILDSNFRIRFQFYGNTAIPTDGYAIDEVVLSTVMAPTCQLISDSAILLPERIESEGALCTPETRTLTFVNHTGVTDTVSITYTASPMVSVLDMPDDLGVIPDGGAQTFAARFAVGTGATTGASYYITATAVLSDHQLYSDTTTIEKYVNLASEWQARQDTPYGTRYHAVASHDGTIFQFGGETAWWAPSQTVLQYDIAADSWITSSSMISPAYGMDAVTLGDNIYIPGGSDDTDDTTDGGTFLSSLQIYSTTAGTWSLGAPMTVSLAYASAVAHDGKVYVIGGQENSGVYTNTLFIYDPVGDSWSQGASLSQARGYAAGAAVDDEIYVAGGFAGGTTTLDTMEIYDPVADSWRTGPAAPKAAAFYGDGALRDRHLIAFSGDTIDQSAGTSYSCSTDAYTFDTHDEEWAQLPQLRRCLYGSQGATAGDTFYLVSGRTNEDGWHMATEVEVLNSSPVCECSLDLSKQGSSWVYPDHVASYAIRMSNTGGVSATTNLTDALSTDVDYAGNLACGGLNCWYSGTDDAVYFADDVLPYQTVTVTFDVTATAPVSTVVANTARAGYCDQSIEDTHRFHVTSPPDVAWEKKVAVNGGAWQDYRAGPFDVSVDDLVHISETLRYTGTFPHFATIVEDWPGYPLLLQGEAHTDGAVGWLPGGQYGWGVTLSPGASESLSRTFQVTDTLALITITEQLWPDDMPAEQRDVVLAGDVHTLTVATDGSGSGVVDPPVGEHTYEHGTTVWLTATADLDSTFTGWRGAVVGAAESISVAMNSDAAITATFDLLTYTLTVATDGSGSGMVDPPVGEHVYEHGTTVWLTATADLDSTFSGWDGAASGAAGSISVAMNSDAAITATFDLLTYTLAVATDGTGSGVVDPPVGEHVHEHGTTVWLTATADLDSTFAGWSGDLSGSTNPTSIIMDGHKMVTATFSAVVCNQLTGVTVDGITSGAPGIYTFTTSYAPVDATPPVAYLWDNGDVTPTTERSLQPGATTLLITATNCTNAAVTDDHSVVIMAPIYLPLAMRG